MKLHLAPMEGVTDFAMRDLLTSIGGVDHCTTEFLRVTDHLLPEILFDRICPELKTGSQTSSGVPVALQLLGGNVTPMAENAALACEEMGATHIDLNFGCPAKTVNKNDGGAALLKSTERLYQIVSAVRKAVPSHIPVTSKIRLGYDDPSQCLENAAAVWSAGSQYVTVHCRTKMNGYQPPAYWEWIPKIKDKVPGIQLVVNGDIFSYEDLLRCQSETGETAFMIGRGILKDPFLFLKIKSALTENDSKIQRVTPEFLLDFFDRSTSYASEFYAVAKTKQWLSGMSKGTAVIGQAFEKMKVIKKPSEFRDALGYLEL